MPVSINIEHILHTIDEACQNWKQRFTTLNNELMDDVRKLLLNCTKILAELSVTIDDHEQLKQNQNDAKRIVLKLKELRYELGALWPATMNSFVRMFLMLAHITS